ncbi:hypothetical protein CIL05_21100 [Virgibacillus profundi]|uniref:SPOR domain-containing protein n=1 Tax=Virgibacillus profundi TaxID=2024555 RepID=A0A2A2I986_9BACI|nr:SPOR domain-containing protein [Virgibacillus profundi]PAV27623.1 hypothetical protein CIL05_21100 [Virgibacillus profundi]PXY51801.1 SPOR domain-containing protein [Virgibacillus profundi]
MGKQKKNGVSNKKNNTKDRLKAFKKSREEHAATLQNPGDDSIPTLARQYEGSNSKKKFGKKEGKLKHFKPVIVTTIAAIAIGSILGFVMLRMFVIIDGDLSANGSNNTPVLADDTDKDEEESSTATSTSLYMLEPIQAFVLQSGVFSEQANADEWAAKYDEAGLPSIIWEMDNQYFLLAGLGNTNDHAKQSAAELSADGFDIFVKEWNTGEIEVELTKEEHAWLKTFVEQWEETLASLTSNEVFSVASWKELINNYPEGTKKLSGLSETIEEVIDEMSTAENRKAQHILLKLWLQYDKVTNN